VVAKLYYWAPSRELLQAYQAAFGELAMRIDGAERRAAPSAVRRRAPCGAVAGVADDDAD